MNMASHLELVSASKVMRLSNQIVVK